MATQIINTNGISKVTQLQFIRARDVLWTASDLRPNTRYFAFFDGSEVTDRCTQNPYDNAAIPPVTVTPARGVIYSDNAGKANGVFSIPDKTFTVGIKEFLLTDTLDTAITPKGSYTSKASARYDATGLSTNPTAPIPITIAPEVVNEVVNVAVPPPVVPSRPIEVPSPAPLMPPAASFFAQLKLDPVAQSFFTYGIKGGFFLTKIEIFFQSKDSSVPVQLEIRNMLAGQPGAVPINEWAVVSLAPEHVATSTDASVPTAFVFERPLYLEEDKDYCFVVKCNTKNYQIWTSRMGEKMIDRDAMITEQPYVGSLFKSENGITWTAEQYEDVKFKMFQAVFDTDPAPVRFDVHAPQMLIRGSQISTSSGSSYIDINTDVDHCMVVGDRVKLGAIPDGDFNGISSEDIQETTAGLGYLTVVAIPDRTTIQVQAAANATSTGPITSCGKVLFVQIDNAGTGYAAGTTISLNVTPSGGDTPSTAAIVSAIVSRTGKIAQVEITEHGVGYYHTPVITIPGGTPGSGAVFSATIEPEFFLAKNAPMDAVMVKMDSFIPAGTGIESSIVAATGTSPYGTEVAYDVPDPTPIELNVESGFRNRRWVLSEENRKAHATAGAHLDITLNTDNENVSPVLYGYGTGAHVRALGYILNPQELELNYGHSTVNATAMVAGTPYQILTVGTSNFKTAGAKFNVPGESFVAGYTGSAGSGTGVLYKNSEVLTEGNALARYLSNRVSLNYAANGFLIYITAYSEKDSNIDIYVRVGTSSVDATSINSIDYPTQPWIRLVCDVDRNKSATPSDFYEYEFYNEYDLEDFDVFEVKIVLRGTNPAKYPVINDYRCVAIAN